MARPWCCTTSSLALDEGQTLALLGRNGTGKTTLINTLAGATRQHGGSIALGGAALHKLRRTSAPRPASAGCRRSATSSSRSPCTRT